MGSSGNNLMRSLGAFFGHIAHAVKTDPDKGEGRKQEVRREVEEREETMPDGRKVTVRRTTIEELEVSGDRRERKPTGEHDA